MATSPAEQRGQELHLGHSLPRQKLDARRRGRARCRRSASVLIAAAGTKAIVSGSADDRHRRVGRCALARAEA